MKQNVYEYSFELRKARHDKIARILTLVVSVFLFVSLFLQFILFPVRVRSDSMEGDIVKNSALFVTPLLKTPKRGDVFYLSRMDGEKPTFFKGMVNTVVRFFSAQQWYVFGNTRRMSGQPLVRRVLALPGDTIYMKDFMLYVRPLGEKLFLREDELTEKSYNIHIYSIPAEWDNLGISGDMAEVTLQDGEYFVLADNRVEATDSRVWGMVPASHLKGKVLVEYFPFNKFHLF